MKFLKRVSSCLFVALMISACGSTSSDSVPIPVSLPASHVVANSDGGLYVKGVNDNTWTLIENTLGNVYSGLTQLRSGALIASVKGTPTTNVAVKAATKATATEAILISADMGKTWEVAGATSADETIANFINFIDGTILACGNKGIWRSDDGAKSWSDVSPVAGGSCTNLVSLSDGGVITYFASKIWHSADSGKTWVDSFTLATHFIGNFKEFSAGVVLSTGYSVGAENKILKSANFGKAWAEVQAPALLIQYERLSDDMTLAIGGGKLYKSANNGDTWDAVAFTGATTLNSFIALANGDLLASSEGGVVKSSDKGATWTLTDLKWASASDGATFQLINGVVYAIYSKTGAGSEILKYSALTSSWGMELAINESIKSLLATGGSYGSAVTTDPVPAPTPELEREYTHLIAVDSSLSRPGRLYIKGMNEESWTILDDNADNKSWRSLAQLNDGTLLASVEVKSVPPTTRKEIRRSEDLGKTWTTTETPDDNKTCDMFLQLSDSTVLVAGRGVWRSEDNGKTWKETELTENIYSLFQLADGSVLASMSSTIMGGGTSHTRNTINKSVDSGKTWVSVFVEEMDGYGYRYIVDLGMGIILSYTWSAMNTSPEGILKSTDFGATWKKIDTTFSISDMVRLSDGEILATSYDSLANLMISSDNGDTWKKTKYAGEEVFSDFRVFPNNVLLGAGLTMPMPMTTIYKSTDKGDNWVVADAKMQECPMGMTCSFDLYPIFNGVAFVGKSISLTMLMPTTTEFWTSADSGVTWAKDSQIDGYLRDITPVIKFR